MIKNQLLSKQTNPNKPKIKKVLNETKCVCLYMY